MTNVSMLETLAVLFLVTTFCTGFPNLFRAMTLVLYYENVTKGTCFV